jgi:hypothetical protein
VCALAVPARAGLTPSDYREPATDSTYAAAVREYTTDPRFLPGPVAELPSHPDVPSPSEFLGYVVGAPRKLTYYTEIEAYMRALADASPRVTLESMGRTNEGREMIVVLIAEDGIIRALERNAEYTARLADPRVTDEDEAQEIIDVALPFYYLCGGLHSTETGSPEMLMELAYRLAVGESPLVTRIRNNVVTMITPVLETDGRERMVDWYYNVTIDYDDWDDMPPKSPPYWGKYVFHDNNRDGLQMTQPLSRNFANTFFKYHPQVLHDLHESVPLLYVSSGTGPYNDSLDPIITNEWQWFANNEVTEMTKLGMPGVWTWGFYTGWWPGYLMWVANNHNSVGRFYETFGNAGASTFERELKGKFAGKEVTTRQWYRSWPPDKKVEWSFRNTINYMETGALLALDFCARNNQAILYNFWKKGANSLERGRTTAPYAFVVRRDGNPRWETARLLNTLLDQRIEVSVLGGDVQIGDDVFRAGDFVVRMDQPYRDFAVSLMEPQKFPEDAEHTPYDDVAWTLPLLYGVAADRVDDDTILAAEMSRVDAPVLAPAPPPREPDGRGALDGYYVIPASSSSTTLRARYMLADFEVFAADTAFTARDTEYPRGSWIVAAGDDRVHTAAAAVARELGLDVDGVREVPDVPRHELDIPRIAVFHTWLYTQDSGWVRYTLDRDDIPYTLINKDDVRDGKLRDYYDVILIPNTGSWYEPRDLVHGVDPAHGPIPYPPGAGSTAPIDEADDITGGMGFAGLAELERFVDTGGTLVTFGAASMIPVDLGLVRHVDRFSPAGFSNPGSVVRTRVVDPASNLVVGHDQTSSVFRGNFPLLKVDEDYTSYVVLQYGMKSGEDGEAGGDESTGAGGEPICLSGMVKGEEHMDGKPAILDIPRGAGRIVVYTFNPLHRYLNLSDFGLAYNAILHWND